MNSKKIWQVITRVIVASVGALLFVGLIGVAAQAASDTPPHTSLYVVNADGSGFKLLRDDPNYPLWGPAYSPDGSKIAVTFVAPSGDRGELYLLDADGQHPTIMDFARRVKRGIPKAEKNFQAKRRMLEALEVDVIVTPGKYHLKTIVGEKDGEISRMAYGGGRIVPNSSRSLDPIPTQSAGDDLLPRPTLPRAS